MEEIRPFEGGARAKSTDLTEARYGPPFVEDASYASSPTVLPTTVANRTARRNKPEL